MSSVTHATSVNWRSSGGVGDLAEPHEQLAGGLARMDGKRFWGYSLWPIPGGQEWPDVDIDPNEFLQSAGNAQRMSIELREVDPDGTVHQYAIGRPGTVHEGEPSVPVTWSVDHGILVYPGEEYTAEQAAPVYISYYDTGRVPSDYVLRELDLGAA